MNKVAIIGPAFPFRGGISAYNERLAKAFEEQGKEVTIYNFTLQYPPFLFPGKTQYSTDLAPKNLKIINCINSINPLNWLKVGKMIKNALPDLVIVRYWIPFMGPCFGTILRQVKKNKHTKIINIVDNMIPHESRPGDNIFTSYFVTPIDGFIAMTKTVLDDIAIFDTNKPRLLSPHPLYDHFGEISDRTEALNKLKLNPSSNYILFFGLIRDYKGLDLLLKAFADKRFRTENIKLIIAGEYYSNKEVYTRLIKENYLENDVIQTDKFIPDSEVADYFNACDLVVQPYKKATQSGVTQIAYHFNRPMIVTDVGGLAEMCPNEKVGYVVHPEPIEIADAILKFFNNTDKIVMKENIIEEKKKYSWEILLKNINNLMEKL